MSAMIVSALVMVLAILVTMARFDLLKFLGYAAVVDIAFTILMFMMFAGTFSGIVAGSFAGLFMTGLLSLLRKTLGYKKLQRVGWRVVWVYHPGTLSIKRAQDGQD